MRGASYEISGNASVPFAELVPLLRLRDGQPFASTRLDADVQAIEDLYHRRGFAAARVSTAVELVAQTPQPAVVPVTVRAVIAEGPATTIDAVTFEGNTALDQAALRAKVQMRAGTPYMPG